MVRVLRELNLVSICSCYFISFVVVVLWCDSSTFLNEDVRKVWKILNKHLVQERSNSKWNVDYCSIQVLYLILLTFNYFIILLVVGLWQNCKFSGRKDLWIYSMGVRNVVDSFSIYEIMNRNDFIVRRKYSTLLLHL